MQGRATLKPTGREEADHIGPYCVPKKVVGCLRLGVFRARESRNRYLTS